MKVENNNQEIEILADVINIKQKKNPTIKELKDTVIKELINDKLYVDEYKNRIELLKIILDYEK